MTNTDFFTYLWPWEINILATVCIFCVHKKYFTTWYSCARSNALSGAHSNQFLGHLHGKQRALLSKLDCLPGDPVLSFHVNIKLSSISQNYSTLKVPCLFKAYSGRPHSSLSNTKMNRKLCSKFIWTLPKCSVNCSIPQPWASITWLPEVEKTVTAAPSGFIQSHISTTILVRGRMESLSCLKLLLFGLEVKGHVIDY